MLFKIRLLFEPKNLLWKKQIYKKNDPVEKDLSRKVVLDIIDSCKVKLKGRNVTSDNFFTSFELAKSKFINTSGRTRVSSLFGFNEDATIVSFMHRKRM